MKKLSANEMRAVDGGYHLWCVKCGVVSGYVNNSGLKRFCKNHRHGLKWTYKKFFGIIPYWLSDAPSYAAYDDSFEDARKYFCSDKREHSKI